MNELEYKIYEAILMNDGDVLFRAIRVNCAKIAAKIALKEIKEAYEEAWIERNEHTVGGFDVMHNKRHRYLKQKGYE